jgi:cytochrome oxidase assembly protein ShyY1
VFRTALRPRWLALLAVVLAVAAVMARLGEWQLGRARQQGERDRQAAAAAQPAVPVQQLLPAGAAFPVSALDRRVTVLGRWDGARQLLVPGRRLGDATGLWVVTPLRLPDGSAVAVVRGWVPESRVAGSSPSGPAALPAGDVRLDGVLRPSEPVGDLLPGALAEAPSGQVPVASAALFAQAWPYPLVDGFVLQTSPATAGLQAVPTERGTGELALQNLSYALQWWLFSAFGLFFWFRLVRDDARGRLHAGAASAAGPPVGDDGARGAPAPTADAGDRP